ncbi:MAG: DUF1080 domain-containing protein [Acidobacteria bacterium]|nr:DUF1080 domain-containing protein [Acidobacteriota bacterium]
MSVLPTLYLLLPLAQSLFDGQTTKGWQTQTRPDFPARSWTIENGALCSIAVGPRADLSSVGSYRSFEFTFDWWIASGTNSGVKYLVFGTRPNPDTGKFDIDVPKALGLELQLIDDERVPDARVSPTRATGALYLFGSPSNVPNLPVETWHQARIVDKGRTIEHWLNGVKVFAADLESSTLRSAMAAEKRVDIPKPTNLDELKANPKKKYPLVLTHHGGKGCYRNLQIRVLD